MDNGPFIFGDNPLTISGHAQIQPGTRKRIQTVLDLYDPDWFTDRDLIVMEHEWEKRQGRRLVAPTRTTSSVRYGDQPNSQAKPCNQQPVPFIYQPVAGGTRSMSVYLRRAEDRLQLVRAHFGRPFPPAPFQTSAQEWPGYQGVGLNLRPGSIGCADYWHAHAYITTDSDYFEAMDLDKPDWLN